ncbi:YsnF/AvaK domain-containing protein [Bacillus xiapuensis]|uniref:YsnF/AvaK domain-containing protein n=1 Tax=Bacillus xiapuensis TaxID=2014075 RepID=UPI000C2498D6|nr:YsnF/AvaK domain-containing protein [Bacillus xiapuensis]
MDKNKKLIGLFNNQSEVIPKIEDLKNKGYAEDDIYVVAKNEDQVSMVRGRTGIETESAAGASWWDRFIAFLSGEDEVRGGLKNMGLNDKEAERYYQDIEAGKLLLYVDKDYEQHYPSRLTDEATDPNLGANALGVNIAKADGHVDGVRADRVPELDADPNLTEEQRLKLREERLQVDKEKVKTGEVQVEKDVVEEDRTVDVNVEHEEVYVERRPVYEESNDADAAPIVDDEDRIRIPITEERVEVTKKPVVTEEIVVGKRKVEDTEEIHDTVKREEAHVERTDGLPMEEDEITDPAKKDRL